MHITFLALVRKPGPRGLKSAWNSAGHAKTFAHENGWSLGLVIPWSSLRFQGSREQQIWGMNLCRRIRPEVRLEQD